MTFDEKRKILLDFRRMPEWIEANNELLLRLRSEAEKITPSLNGDGSAFNGINADKTPKIVEKIVEAEEKAKQLDGEYKRLRVEIPAAVARLKAPEERSALFYHYIKGLNYFQCAEKMNYSDRWIRKFLVSGINNLDI